MITLQKPVKLHLKRGDTVKVIAGNYRGTVGTVLHVYPRLRRAVVQGVNMLTHFIKPNKQSSQDPNQPKGKGSIQKREGKIHISNLMVINPSSQEPTRIGRKLNEKGVLQRYAKRGNQFI